MLRNITKRIAGHLRAPSAATIIALLALFVALGSTTYAAINLPANSVGTKQIKNAAVTNWKIKNGAVGTNKIADRAVTKAKLNVTGVTVPDATNANHATNADNAGSAANATSADSASSPGTLKSGQTLRGAYATGIANAGAPGEQIRTAVSFLFQFPSAISASAVHFVAQGAAPPAGCPGSSAAPEAASGNLCVYEYVGGNYSSMTIRNPTNGSLGASKFGFYLLVVGAAVGQVYSYGTWAVTG